MRRLVWNLCLTAILIGLPANFAGAFDVETFIANFENGKDQTVLVGQIDSLTINRGPAEFYLGRGELTLLDFGCGTPCALIFQGKARFIYNPVDDIEKQQLKRFTGKDNLDQKLDSLCIYFSDTGLIDTSQNYFEKIPIDENKWKQFYSAQDHAFSNLGIYLPNKLLGNLLMESSPHYFYADLYMKNMGRYAYRIDAHEPDVYCLYKLIMKNGHETFDILNGSADDHWLVSERGVIPIDITDYDIETFISSNGDMRVKCRVYYSTIIPDVGFLYFNWYKKNKIISAFDSNGDSLIFIEKREPFKVLVNQHLESGFGVVLNNPLTTGGSDFIDFEYECGCLYNWLGFFYVSGNTSWYPMNIIRDPATFHLSYIYPVDYRVVSSGENISKELTSTGVKSAWLLNYPSCGVSFNIGKYYDVRLFFENLLPIEVFTHMPINIPEIGADMLNSLAYFSDLFGVCPFEIIKVADAPGGSRGSSPGLENLNWDDLIRGTKEGPKRMANQWWIHTLRHESYKDEWIVEGLSNYCSFMYFEKSKQRYLVDDGFMKDWRKMIFYGKGAGSKGTQAGSMILGKRLDSSKSKDYDAVVGRKSAYIFHMLRYLLHDYKTDSDDAFIAFLRDLLDKYRDRPITTAGLQTLLEEHTQTDMTWFFDQWVYGIDIPTYTFSYDTENTPDGQFQVTCHVKQEDVPDDFKMVVPMTVVFEGNQFAHLKYWIDQPEMDIQLPPLPMKPKKIDFNTYDAVLCRVRTQ